MPAPAAVPADDASGAALLELVAVMDRLRSPGGCPWDAEQTHESLLAYLLEEAYEVVDAVGSGDLSHLQEELGDLLLQVVFHARIAQEHPEGAFSIDDVARGITDKLVRRHPHVFSDVEAATADDVARNWDDIKRADKRRESVLDGVPIAQPALPLAQAFIAKAAKAGAPLPDAPIASLADVPDAQAFGGWLLAVVTEAQRRGWDAEASLRAAALEFADQVRADEAASGA
jgi:XTP/dITP diphosphohydrolase